MYDRKTCTSISSVPSSAFKYKSYINYHLENLMLLECIYFYIKIKNGGV